MAFALSGNEFTVCNLESEEFRDVRSNLIRLISSNQLIMAKKQNKTRQDVSKNHYSQQRIPRNQLPDLLVLLNKQKLNISHLFYDKENERIAIHASQAISIGQLRIATNIQWIALKGPQSSIPLVADSAFTNPSQTEKFLISKCEKVQDNVINTELISKIEELEKSNQHLFSKIEELEGKLERSGCKCSKTVNKQIMVDSYESNQRQGMEELDETLYPALESEGLDAHNVPVPPPGFRFAAFNEIPASSQRLDLISTELLYMWPDIGWVRGKIKKRIHRKGFTHVVRYKPAPMWPRGAVVDTLLDAEWYSIRWILLLPLAR